MRYRNWSVSKEQKKPINLIIMFAASTMISKANKF